MLISLVINFISENWLTGLIWNFIIEHNLIDFVFIPFASKNFILDHSR